MPEDMTPEQQKELQEKLAQMSPEELREFQKKNCIFCHIIAGQVQSKKIYEDEKVVAILDINPANPGHVLLMTKEHYSIMPQIPEDIVKYLGIITKQISLALIKALGAQGTTIFIANGVVAGQKAQHFMLHVIPRMEKDGIGLMIKPGQTTLQDQMQLKEVISKNINSALGVEDTEIEKPDMPMAAEVAEEDQDEEEQEPEEKEDAEKEPEEEPEESDETEEITDEDVDDIKKALGDEEDQKEPEDEEPDEEEPEDESDEDQDQEPEDEGPNEDNQEEPEEEPKQRPGEANLDDIAGLFQ